MLYKLELNSLMWYYIKSKGVVLMENYKFIYGPKKVLILGNGFDLAHGLPTRYSDFLNFCKKASRIYTYAKGVSINQYLKENIENWEINEYFKCMLSTAYENRQYDEDITTSNEKINKLYSYIKGNIWYNYFSNDILYETLGRNWIDFESEIKLCIKYIDENSKHLSDYVEDLFRVSRTIGDENVAVIRYSAFKSAVLNNSEKIRTVFELRDVLYDDLENLIQALEIYLNFVESNKITQLSKDILNLDPHYIINFNYTHTYENVGYTPSEISYIHGELNNNPNNMVLGAAEYWSEKEQDSHTNFTRFKKFAQRIQKTTSVESYKWIEEIEHIYKNNQAVSEVHIFGHSLNIPDKDILYDYLENEATSVVIYCKDEKTKNEYVENVISIISEKRLREKTTQCPPKLRFVIQQPMVPIEKEEKELLISGATT